jgi:dihydrofolate reductase
MRKLILFMHTSLDGFVASSKGALDWILIDQDMFDIAAQRTSDSDTALYGRVTFQLMENYWPTAALKPDATQHDIEHSKWYNNVQKIVLSRTLKQSHFPKIRIIRDDIIEEIKKTKQMTGKDILIFGSPTASHTLMAENLIDDYWLFINPIMLGSGIPLFRSAEMIKLKLVESKVFPSGVICIHYQK